jgi:hypothetical protein
MTGSGAFRKVAADRQCARGDRAGTDARGAIPITVPRYIEHGGDEPRAALAGQISQHPPRERSPHAFRMHISPQRGVFTEIDARQGLGLEGKTEGRGTPVHQNLAAEGLNALLDL